MSYWFHSWLNLLNGMWYYKLHLMQKGVRGFCNYFMNRNINKGIVKIAQENWNRIMSLRFFRNIRIRVSDRKRAIEISQPEQKESYLESATYEVLHIPPPSSAQMAEAYKELSGYFYFGQNRVNGTSFAVGDIVEASSGDRPFAAVVLSVNEDSEQCDVKYYETETAMTVDWKHLSRMPPAAVDLSLVAVGWRCQALYSRDQGWYSAEIERITLHGCVVRFIDYGNREEVPLQYLRPASATDKNLFSFPKSSEDQTLSSKTRGYNFIGGNDYSVVAAINDDGVGTLDYSLPYDDTVWSESPIKVNTAEMRSTLEQLFNKENTASTAQVLPTEGDHSLRPHFLSRSESFPPVKIRHEDYIDNQNSSNSNSNNNQYKQLKRSLSMPIDVDHNAAPRKELLQKQSYADRRREFVKFYSKLPLAKLLPRSSRLNFEFTNEDDSIVTRMDKTIPMSSRVPQENSSIPRIGNGMMETPLMVISSSSRKINGRVSFAVTLDDIAKSSVTRRHSTNDSDASLFDIL
jgi:hypothetical protein